MEGVVEDEGPTELMTVISGGAVGWNHSGDDVEESSGCQRRRGMRCLWYGSTACFSATEFRPTLPTEQIYHAHLTLMRTVITLFKPPHSLVLVASSVAVNSNSIPRASTTSTTSNRQAYSN